MCFSWWMVKIQYLVWISNDILRKMKIKRTHIHKLRKWHLTFLENITNKEYVENYTFSGYIKPKTERGNRPTYLKTLREPIVEGEVWKMEKQWLLSATRDRNLWREKIAYTLKGNSTQKKRIQWFDQKTK